MPITPATRGILSTSGKGGVGKSLFSIGLSLELARRGNVGLLDIDTRSPNIPYILGIQGEAETKKDGTVLTKKYSTTKGDAYREVEVFSSSFIFSDGKSVTMPGEEVRSLIKDFIRGDVQWGPVDYLVLDVDPGPGDSIRAARDSIPKLDAFVVTGSDISSTQDADRMLDALANEGIHALGIVGNMIGATCRHCGHVIDDGTDAPVRSLAEKHDVPYFGSLPWDPKYRSDPIGSVTTGEGAWLFARMAEAVAR